MGCCKTTKKKNDNEKKSICIRNNDDGDVCVIYFLQRSYVKSCDKSIGVSVQRITRSGSTVTLTYRIWSKVGQVYASQSTWPWDGSSSIVGSDDTGNQYRNGYPYQSGNIEIYIGGNQVGTYGNGQMFTLDGIGLTGTVVFKNVSSAATTVTVKIPTTSNTPNLTFECDMIEFVNIEIEKQNEARQ